VKSYSPSRGQQIWGVFLPLYAAHSGQSWGAGNLGDCQKLASWVGDLGGGVIATLPLLSAFLDSPVCEPSPYSPASRLFWNEFYLDVRRIPEFSTCPAARRIFHSPAFQKRLAAFRSESLIDYRAQMTARRQVLEPMASAFFASGAARSDSFQRFLQERPLAKNYAEFRAVGERLREPWQQWPERLQRGKIQSGDYAARARDYHLYVQWLIQEQMRGLLSECRARGVQFYLDLPLGVHPEGYDVWREREVFATAATVGAPPDPFFTKGQDWGFPPLHPGRLRQTGYRYVLEYLRFHLRHTGLLRIDHIMGLQRLYWVPAGFPPTQGAYVNYPAEELLALMSLESHRHETVLVGENLGTVPPEVNAAMARHDLRRQPLRVPPRRSVASLNTHDMPTFAAHFRGLDIADRASLGLVPKNQVRRSLVQRKKMGAALAQFLKRKGFLKSERAGSRAMVAACLRWLGAGPSEIVLVNLEDLWQEEQPQNVPGTCAERPNWRRKSRVPLERIISSPPLRQVLEDLAQARGSRCARRRGSGQGG
jgi:4-alpha-glucanotransferase